MQIKDALRAAKQRLKKNSDSPKLDAQILLAFILKQPKEYLFLNDDRTLTETQIKKYQQLTERRVSGEPVAYLIGSKEFFGLNFLVNKTVLIPRPESEILIETGLLILKNKHKPRIADIGTGSGCLVITLAKHLPKAKIYASDICRRALKTAIKNAELNGVSSQINFQQSDLAEAWKNKNLDLLIANLPYGWKEWKNNCSMNTTGLRYEPAKALFTEEKGLKLYRKLLEQITVFKYKPENLLFEFDPRQTSDFKKLVKQYLPEYKIKIIKDLAGHDRVLHGKQKK